jgi:ankyrin repeat protein
MGVKQVFDFYEGEDDLALKLSVAVIRGDAQQAVRFIAQGADFNMQQQQGGLPLLHEAIGRGHMAIVEAMLASGRCDLTVRDSMGRLPSDIAGLVARDYELAERLAGEQAKQFRARKMDPRRPDHPDYGNWKWDT